MQRTKFIAFFISVVGLFGLLFTTPRVVVANSVCTTVPPPTACIMQWVLYTWQADCACDVYGVCQTCQYSEMREVCTIPQADGSTCSCCFEDGCYLNCPGTNPTGPGGDPDPTVDPPGGSTPTPVSSTPIPTPTTAPGTITAVARAVTTDTTCAAITNSTTGVDGTQFSFTASSANQPPAQTQTGNVPVTFASQPAGSYTINHVFPSSEWTLANSCIYLNGVLVAYGNSATLSGGGTLDWRLGFTRGSPWVQAEGGDVIAATTLRSYIPNITPRVFNADGDGGYPGVVTYGTSYDFDSNWASTGATFASTEAWLVQTTQNRVNYYDYFYRRFGSPTTPYAFADLLAVTEPASSETPYYVVGDMTTSGNWSVGDGESLLFIVDGDVTIGGRINTTGSGFVTFIVNGDIIVDTAVGTTSASTIPVLEGIYITSPTGSFRTGPSTIAASARFVGEGIFIAGNFLLQRDLDGYGTGNTTHAAELFVYNPQLLFTMPGPMKELPVTWQEVAP